MHHPKQLTRQLAANRKMRLDPDLEAFTFSFEAKQIDGTPWV
jgi:hypothetical protein